MGVVIDTSGGDRLVGLRRSLTVSASTDRLRSARSSGHRAGSDAFGGEFVGGFPGFTGEVGEWLKPTVC